MTQRGRPGPAGERRPALMMMIKLRTLAVWWAVGVVVVGVGVGVVPSGISGDRLSGARRPVIRGPNVCGVYRNRCCPGWRLSRRHLCITPVLPHFPANHTASASSRKRPAGAKRTFPDSHDVTRSRAKPRGSRKSPADVQTKLVRYRGRGSGAGAQGGSVAGVNAVVRSGNRYRGWRTIPHSSAALHHGSRSRGQSPVTGLRLHNARRAAVNSRQQFKGSKAVSDSGTDGGLGSHSGSRRPPVHWRLVPPHRKTFSMTRRQRQPGRSVHGRHVRGPYSLSGYRPNTRPHHQLLHQRRPYNTRQRGHRTVTHSARAPPLQGQVSQRPASRHRMTPVSGRPGPPGARGDLSTNPSPHNATMRQRLQYLTTVMRSQQHATQTEYYRNIQRRRQLLLQRQEHRTHQPAFRQDNNTRKTQEKDRPPKPQPFFKPDNNTKNVREEERPREAVDMGKRDSQNSDQRLVSNEKHSTIQGQQSNSTTQGQQSNSTTQGQQSNSTTQGQQSNSTNSTTQRQQSNSTTQGQQSNSTIQGQQSNSTTQRQQSNSTTQRQQSNSTTQRQQSNSTTQGQQSNSTTQGQKSNSTFRAHIPQKHTNTNNGRTTISHQSEPVTQRPRRKSNQNDGYAGIRQRRPFHYSHPRLSVKDTRRHPYSRVGQRRPEHHRQFSYQQWVSRRHSLFINRRRRMNHRSRQQVWKKPATVHNSNRSVTTTSKPSPSSDTVSKRTLPDQKKPLNLVAGNNKETRKDNKGLDQNRTMGNASSSSNTGLSLVTKAAPKSVSTSTSKNKVSKIIPTVNAVAKTEAKKIPSGKLDASLMYQDEGFQSDSPQNDIRTTDQEHEEEKRSDSDEHKPTKTLPGKQRKEISDKRKPTNILPYKQDGTTSHHKVLPSTSKKTHAIFKTKRNHNLRAYLKDPRIRTLLRSLAARRMGQMKKSPRKPRMNTQLPFTTSSSPDNSAAVKNNAPSPRKIQRNKIPARHSKAMQKSLSMEKKSVSRSHADTMFTSESTFPHKHSGKEPLPSLMPSSEPHSQFSVSVSSGTPSTASSTDVTHLRAVSVSSGTPSTASSTDVTHLPAVSVSSGPPSTASSTDVTHLPAVSVSSGTPSTASSTDVTHLPPASDPTTLGQKLFSKTPLNIPISMTTASSKSGKPTSELDPSDQDVVSSNKHDLAEHSQQNFHTTAEDFIKRTELSKELGKSGHSLLSSTKGKSVEGRHQRNSSRPGPHRSTKFEKPFIAKDPVSVSLEKPPANSGMMNDDNNLPISGIVVEDVNMPDNDNADFRISKRKSPKKEYDPSNRNLPPEERHDPVSSYEEQRYEQTGEEADEHSEHSQESREKDARKTFPNHQIIDLDIRFHRRPILLPPPPRKHMPPVQSAREESEPEPFHHAPLDGVTAAEPFSHAPVDRFPEQSHTTKPNDSSPEVKPKENPMHIPKPVLKDWKSQSRGQNEIPSQSVPLVTSDTPYDVTTPCSDQQCRKEPKISEKNSRAAARRKALSPKPSAHPLKSGCPPGHRRVFRAQSIVCEPFIASFARVTPGQPCEPGQVSVKQGGQYTCRSPAERPSPSTTPTLEECPQGQKAYPSRQGPVCLPERLAPTLTPPSSDRLCPPGMTPVESSAGVHCLRAGGSFTSTTSPQTPSPTDVTPVREHGPGEDVNRVRCPEGMTAVSTVSGEACGFPAGLHHNRPTCPEGQALMRHKGGYQCRPHSVFTRGDAPCPAGQTPVRTITGTVCHHNQPNTAINVLGYYDCTDGQILTQTSSGFFCLDSAKGATGGERPSSGSALPRCSPGFVAVKLASGELGCVRRSEASLKCSSGMELKKTSAGYFCQRRVGDRGQICLAGQVLLTYRDRSFCRQLDRNGRLCKDGYKPHASSFGFTCKKQFSPLACPAGFFLTKRKGHFSCFPVKSSTNICRDSSFTKRYGNRVLCKKGSLYGVLVPCEQGYHVINEEAEPVCKLQNDVIISCQNDVNEPVPSCTIQENKPCPGGCPKGNQSGPMSCRQFREEALQGCQPRCANGGRCVEGRCVCPAGVTGTACQEGLY
ncbi:uncharacterized protein LOC143291588 isoform X2 [Babylonia areolata]|uniref:uncharacterized protein LOC143291588 isoform X2 n=1 Tax=Babylonia areolata TaxID=304850 RepID=UPI003FD31F67